MTSQGKTSLLVREIVTFPLLVSQDYMDLSFKVYSVKSLLAALIHQLLIFKCCKFPSSFFTVCQRKRMYLLVVPENSYFSQMSENIGTLVFWLSSIINQLI